MGTPMRKSLALCGSGWSRESYGWGGAGMEVWRELHAHVDFV